jgi:uncharacterized membrane protein YjjP (DUF1212 family)
MLLLGLLLVLYLVGIIGAGMLFPIFLVGIGAIFLVMALLKARAPAPYEMSARTTLAYGTVAVIIGVLWITLSVQALIAGYVLAAALIFFGLLFLAYSRIKPASA